MATNQNTKKHSENGNTKQNPYKLVCWRADWSEAKTNRNNSKYWEWEVKHNGLRLL